MDGAILHLDQPPVTLSRDFLHHFYTTTISTPRFYCKIVVVALALGTTRNSAGGHENPMIPGVFVPEPGRLGLLDKLGVTGSSPVAPTPIE
jgi:hypothetical protein